MSIVENRLPVLPLSLANVPASLVRALAQEGVPTQPQVPDRAVGKFVLFDSQQGPQPEFHRSQVAIDVHALRGGFRDDPFLALDDERTTLSRWQIDGIEVSEEVSLVDKRDVRTRLLRELRTLLEAAGGVWLRLSAYPFPYRSAFNFRLDHDEYEADDLDRLLEVSQGHEAAFSHFVCGSSYEQHPEGLAKLQGYDVGSHGYWHHTYTDYETNLRNIGRGIDVLRQHGIEPSGFVAPHGRFNHGMFEALSTLGVTHSSEFGLAFDELPFFPGATNVLQIPVHPICLGLFLDTVPAEARSDATLRAAADRARQYFVDAAVSKYQAGEPVFLYCHPDGRLGRYPQVVRDVLATVGQFAAVWKTNLTEFGAWWRARAAVGWQVFREIDHFLILVHHKPAGFRFGVEYLRGEHVAPMPIDERLVRFAPGALAYQTRKPLRQTDRWRVDSPQGLRDGVKRYLDWEKTTPIGEIDASTWRGWFKRTLRRIRH